MYTASASIYGECATIQRARALSEDHRDITIPYPSTVHMYYHCHTIPISYPMQMLSICGLTYRASVHGYTGHIVDGALGAVGISPNCWVDGMIDVVSYIDGNALLAVYIRVPICWSVSASSSV